MKSSTSVTSWRRRHALLGLACWVSLPWSARAEALSETRAHALFVQATQTKTSADIDAAAAAYTQLLSTRPDDGVVMTYAGAITAMQATTTLLPWRKMRFADDGLALIDKALARLSPAQEAVAYRATPAVLEIQLTAATTFLALPAMFQRRERGLKLLANVATHPLLAQTPAAFQAAVRMAQQHAPTP